MAGNFVKKTIYLNQEYINKVLEIFHVKTEKEAVNLALKAVCEEGEIIKIHKEIGGKADIEEVFNESNT